MPPDLLDTDDGDALSISDLLDEWPLIEYDFQHLLGIRLEQERHSLSWRAFRTYLMGLFGAESSLVRIHFRPAKHERPDQDAAQEPQTFD